MSITLGAGILLGAGIVFGPTVVAASTSPSDPLGAINSNSSYTGPYNTISGKPRPTTTRSFTVEGWIKWDNSASRLVGTFIGSPSDTTRQPHFLAIYFDDKGPWNGSQNPPGSYIVIDGYFLNESKILSPISFQRNTWYHIAVSRDASNNNIINVWVNGQQAGSTSDSRVYSANSLTIGNGWPNPQNGLKFVGYQSDIRVISNAYVYNPTSSTITVPTAPLTTTSDCIALIQSNATGALATDNSTVGQSLSFTGLSHNSSSPYAGANGAGGSWYNSDGNGAIVMDPGVYNC